MGLSIIGLILVPNFSLLNRQFFIMWTKFAQEVYFWSKTEKVNITIQGLKNCVHACDYMNVHAKTCMQVL